MLEHLMIFSISRMTKVFRVSRSGFYYWVENRHKAIQREAARQKLDTKVKEAFDVSKERDGSRRIQKELAESGENHNLIRLQSMQQSMKQAEQQRQAAEVTRGTSHISVTDAQGNLASLTLSNGEGNGVVLSEHGFMLNNFLGEEDLNPNGFFKWELGDPLRSMMAPSLIINDQSRMALGTGGSNRIKTTLFQVIDRLCHDETLKNAISAPRCHYEKGHLDIEHGFNPTDIAMLKKQCPNHLEFKQPSLYFGGVNAAQSGEQTLGYADFRRHGCGITGTSHR